MLNRFFDGHRQLFIRQRKEWTEIAIDWETRNQYEVLGSEQERLGAIAERAGGAADFLKRAILRSHRGFQIRVVDREDQTLLDLARPFFFLFSDLDVMGAQGEKLGSVHRRFGVLYKRYDLRDATGMTFAKVRSPLWRLWTFPVLSTRGSGDAVITKRWSGALREVFADADAFLIDYAQGTWNTDERAVIFAAALSIDFDFFENNQGVGGLLNVFDFS